MTINQIGPALTILAKSNPKLLILACTWLASLALVLQAWRVDSGRKQSAIDAQASALVSMGQYISEQE